MTDLLYLSTIDAAYERTFEARITALPPGSVVLDRTLFYPTGGGQPCDLGTLRLEDGSEVAVEDVTKSGAAVMHRVGRRSPPESLAVGRRATGTIDWARRHRHMRLHTFQHLLSARLFAVTGRRTRRAAFSGQEGWVDLEPSGGVIDVTEMTRDLATYLEGDRPVRVRFVPRAEYEASPANRSGLVPLPPQVDPVRVVEIEEADRCPCGGTHVRRLGEIGPFELQPPRLRSGTEPRVAFRLLEAAPPTRSS